MKSCVSLCLAPVSRGRRFGMFEWVSQPKRSAITDLEYHLRRARSERDVAYRLGDGVAADAHMRLSALHLARALLLQRVKTEPVGNVRPFTGAPAAAASPLPVRELRSIR